MTLVPVAGSRTPDSPAHIAGPSAIGARADPRKQRWVGPCQILALDGGGIKGLFAAAMVAKLEEKLGSSILDHFDLIAGTSTGGLIALGLGLGMRPRAVIEFYVNEGPKVFSNMFHWRSLLQWVWHKYPQRPLKAALSSTDGFTEKKLGDSNKRLVIPSYNLSTDTMRVFKTPHHERLTTDWKIPAWKIALATCAAPTYFPACCHIERTRLIDGGVCANNPSVIGIAEAVSMLGADLQQIRVLSLGTTDTRRHRRRALDRGGVMQWMRRKDVIDVLMRGQSAGTNGIAEHLITKNQLLRIDPIVPDGMYHLDNVAVDDLLAEAEDQALRAGPAVAAMFFQHRAPDYVPPYPSLRR